MCRSRHRSIGRLPPSTHPAKGRLCTSPTRRTQTPLFAPTRTLPRARSLVRNVQAEHAGELQQTRRPPRTDEEEGGEMMQKEKIQHKDDMTVTLPSDREVLITRTLHAPRKLVFEAMTEPRHLKQWLGPRVMTITVADADLRIGGAWRFVHRAPDGTDHAFSGVIREFRAPERVVRTNNYENIPGAESLETMTLEEHGGRTVVTIRVLFKSRDQRDGYIASGAEGGMRESYDRLDELLPRIA